MIPKSKLLEKQIERSILEYLKSKDIFCWKQNTVGVYDASASVYRRPNNPFIITGVSDILGIYKGKMLCIEVKTPERRKNLSIYQRNFLKMIQEKGGIAFVATSVKDVENYLSKYDSESKVIDVVDTLLGNIHE